MLYAKPIANERCTFPYISTGRKTLLGLRKWWTDHHWRKRNKPEWLLLCCDDLAFSYLNVSTCVMAIGQFLTWRISTFVKASYAATSRFKNVTEWNLQFVPTVHASYSRVCNCAGLSYWSIVIETRPGQTTPEQSKPYQSRPDHSRPYHTRPGQARLFQTSPIHTRPHQTRPRQTSEIPVFPRATLTSNIISVSWAQRVRLSLWFTSQFIGTDSVKFCCCTLNFVRVQRTGSQRIFVLVNSFSKTCVYLGNVRMESV